MNYAKTAIAITLFMIVAQTALISVLSDQILISIGFEELIVFAAQHIGLINSFLTNSNYPILFAFVALIYFFFLGVLTLAYSLYFIMDDSSCRKEKSKQSGWLFLQLVILSCIVLFGFWLLVSGEILSADSHRAWRNHVIQQIPNSKITFTMFMSFLVINISYLFAFILKGFGHLFTGR